MIKKILGALLGVIIGVLVVHFSTVLIGKLFGPLYASEEDMQRNLLIYLFCMAFVAVFFGAAGFKLCKNKT